MRAIASLSMLITFGSVGICAGEEPRIAPEAKGVSQVFACQIWHDGGFGAKVVDSADEYAALRERVSEIVFPEGVRRAESKQLRELGDFNFKQNRLLLIWNTSMADDIQVVSASDGKIVVRNVATQLNALQGSAQLLALSVKRGDKEPLVVWENKNRKGG